MSKRTRQSQHKPPRETVKSREMADLRRENHKLKKQVAQVRKQAVRAIDSHFEPMFGGIETSKAAAVPEGGPLTEETLRAAAEKMFAACPCGGRWKRLELGPKTFDVCDSCTARKAVKTGPI